MTIFRFGCSFCFVVKNMQLPKAGAPSFRLFIGGGGGGIGADIFFNNNNNKKLVTQTLNT